MKLFLVSFAVIGCLFHIQSQSLKSGKWRGEIAYENHRVPLSFEVIPTGEDIPEIVFTNGQERRTVLNAADRRR